MNYFFNFTNAANISGKGPDSAVDLVNEYSYKTLFVSSFIILYLLFPLFLFVQRKNQEADKLIPIYPIIKHFHFVVKFILFSITYFSCFMLAYICCQNLFSNLQGVLYFFLFISALGCLMCVFVVFLVPQVQYILHFLLGLQRFCIYFFPASEKYVILSEKRLKILLGVLYALFLFNEVLSLISASLRNGVDFNRHLYIFFGLNVLQLIGALFYIPIMMHVSKLTHLASAALNKPQRYIMFQIITHLISRIVFFPGIYYFQDSPDASIVLVSCADAFLTPLTIQLSYLLCNKKNVKTLFSSSPIVIIKSLIFPNFRPAQVQPEVIESTKC